MSYQFHFILRNSGSRCMITKRLTNQTMQLSKLEDLFSSCILYKSQYRFSALHLHSDQWRSIHRYKYENREPCICTYVFIECLCSDKWWSIHGYKLVFILHIRCILYKSQYRFSTLHLHSDQWRRISIDTNMRIESRLATMYLYLLCIY